MKRRALSTLTVIVCLILPAYSQAQRAHPRRPTAVPAAAATVCVPGAQVTCACPNGTPGVQRCNPGGTALDDCQCTAITPTPVSALAASGDRQGTSAAATPSSGLGATSELQTPSAPVPSSRTADATEAPRPPIYLSLVALVGFGLDDARNGNLRSSDRETTPNSGNQHAFGLGARVGFTLRHFYLGGAFQYGFGYSVAARADSSPPLTMSGQTTTVAAEAGADINAGPLLVRPYLSAGLLLDTYAVDGYMVPQRASNTNRLLGAGVGVYYTVGHLVAGLDGRAGWMSREPGGESLSVVFNALLGVLIY